MEKIDDIKSSFLDRPSFRWALAIITVLGLVVGIYAGFHKRSPRFEYDIVSEIVFFNTQENVSNVKILIDTLDVQENNLNVSIFEIRIENKGGEDIQYDDYDMGRFGLGVKDGTILETPVLLESSSEQIRLRFESEIAVDSSFVHIPNLTLDADDYYSIKLVVLHKEKVSPKFEAIGKISGQKEISVNSLQQDNRILLKDVFKGNLKVQVFRFLCYFLLSISLLVLFIFLSEVIERAKKKHARKKVMREISRNQNLLATVKEDYINNGERYILSLYNVLNLGEAEIKAKYGKSLSLIESEKFKNNQEQLFYHKKRIKTIDRMISNGYLLKSEDKIVINEEMKRSVNHIYAALTKRGLLNKNKFYFPCLDDFSIL